MGSEILSEQRKWYQKTFSEHDDPAGAVGWASRVKQRFRFRRIARLLRPSLDRPSILDVGCGLCHFHEFLLEVFEEHEYTGIDIVPEVIDKAKEKYPGVDTFTHDLVEAPLDQDFDFIVLSGTINRLPDAVDEDNWRAYCFELFRAMFATAQYGMIFNFLTTYNDYEVDEQFYLDPCEVFHFCQTELSRHVELDQSYGLYEGTIAVYTVKGMRKWFEGEPELRDYAE